MYHDLLSLPSSPPGLQPTARRPVEPCINRPLPSPPPHCVAHIMSSRPWHCHCTIARLNYLNAAVIILPPHSRRGHRDRTIAAPGCRAGRFRRRSCMSYGRGRCGQESCHACGGHADICAARPARAWRRGWVVGCFAAGICW